ncbi:HNH endonuclease signature motif containing protein, partial [Rhodococcus sp. 06-235-1A]|uniref:HNH endonuclease signature motif containing protein n=1 Tax=Rhodococcus sp. 06-235-1A TaxID=2022508 RepID=UPI00211B6841
LDQYLASSNRPIEGGERPHLNLHIGLRDLTDLQGSADTDDITDDITDDENTRTAAESDEPPAAERGAYRDLFGDGTSVGWLPWMGPLSRHTSRQLACDCVLTAIVMDENGNPINLARTARTVTATQRKALTARDHGCAFPGCGKPAAWTEGHHIWHWADDSSPAPRTRCGAGRGWTQEPEVAAGGAGGVAPSAGAGGAGGVEPSAGAGGAGGVAPSAGAGGAGGVAPSSGAHTAPPGPPAPGPPAPGPPLPGPPAGGAGGVAPSPGAGGVAPSAGAGAVDPSPDSGAAGALGASDPPPPSVR